MSCEFKIITSNPAGPAARCMTCGAWVNEQLTRDSSKEEACRENARMQLDLFAEGSTENAAPKQEQEAPPKSKKGKREEKASLDREEKASQNRGED